VSETFHSLPRAVAVGRPSPPADLDARRRAHLAQAWAPTETDVRILALVAEGATTEAIARQLALSERTIRRRLAGAARALGVATTVQVVVHAVRVGLV
jgi:DNA-binding NarL/FixJ family response regulator